MEKFPIYIDIAFVVTTLLTVYLFYKASGKSGITLYILAGWLLLQGIIGLSGFYTNTNVTPPRFPLLILPPLVFITALFFTKPGRRYINNLDTKTLTLLHSIRVPVELILFGLFVHKGIPQLMTFEGRNFDIFAGLTAPLIYYFGYVKNKLSSGFLLAWNVICLLLLINIVTNAILSAPLPFQQFGFDQPNIALLYFPYVWLPAVVVPIVLFSHLVTIRYLLKNKKQLRVEKQVLKLTTREAVTNNS